MVFLIQINKPGREACPQAVPAVLVSINAFLFAGASLWAYIYWRDERRQEYQVAPAMTTHPEDDL